MTATEIKRPASYMICATPRSGSTLLCDLLLASGVAGNPHSFFRAHDYAEWAEEFDVPVAQWSGEQDFDQAYLDAVVTYGTGNSSVFGMRLMWESLGDLSSRLDSLFPGQASDSARFTSAFGPLVYIHLSRDDKIAQAVSRRKAEQTGLWHLDSDGSERERIKPGQAPTYDADALMQLVTELEDHDAAWARWFDRQAIAPLSITYETLSSNPQSTLALILSALGQDPAIAKTVQPGTARLADNQSREWVARLRSERR